MRRKILVAIFMILTMGLMACGKSRDADTETTAVVEESFSVEEKDAVNNAGKDEDTENPDGGTFAADIVIEYYPETLEYKGVDMSFRGLGVNVKTSNLTENVAPYFLIGEEKVYMSDIASNDIRGFGIDMYSDLLLEKQEYIDECYLEIAKGVSADEEVIIDIKDEIPETFSLMLGEDVFDGNVEEAIVRRYRTSYGSDDVPELQSICVEIAFYTNNKQGMVDEIEQMFSDSEGMGYDYRYEAPNFITRYLELPEQEKQVSDDNLQENKEEASNNEAPQGTGVVGRWIPSSSTDMYYCIELRMNCTGTLYRADKEYPLTFKINGNYVTVTTEFDGSSIKTEYFYENDTLISDQDETIFVRE